MTVREYLQASPFGGGKYANSFHERYNWEQVFRYFIPRRTCYVNVALEIREAFYPDILHVPCKVDELKIGRANGLSLSQFSFEVEAMDFPLAEAGRLFRKKIVVRPKQMRRFRSGRWCVGNDEINQVLIEHERAITRKYFRSAILEEIK